MSTIKRTKIQPFSKFIKQDGFTIVELVIASAVFSTLLLVSLTSFLQIGQIFFKGVTVSQTSQTAQSIMDGIKADIVYSPDISGLSIRNGMTGSYKYFCIGANRYTYNLGKRVDVTNYDFNSNFGLVKDVVASGCPDKSTPPGFSANRTELLGNKMRLSDLTIMQLAPPNDKLYNIRIRIANGGDDVLTVPATATNVKCSTSRNSSRYCYVYDLNTFVRRGL